MNRKIIVQRLAKVAGSKTQSSFAVIKENSRALRSLKIGLAAAVLVATTGSITAQPLNHFQVEQDYGTDQRALKITAPPRWDRIHFDHSGTRGREGLGASARYPEGPGNVSD
jgi:hypothetical protein